MGTNGALQEIQIGFGLPPNSQERGVGLPARNAASEAVSGRKAFRNENIQRFVPATCQRKPSGRSLKWKGGGSFKAFEIFCVVDNAQFCALVGRQIDPKVPREN